MDDFSLIKDQNTTTGWNLEPNTAGLSPALVSLENLPGRIEIKGRHWLTGYKSINNREIPITVPDWNFKDYLGVTRSRVSAYRMKYSVEPGLYAIGEPGENSDIFVSGNYKLSFDILRRSLKGMSGWILVLDTKSINVWCAAGKGTFGTKELINRIKKEKIDLIVKHRRVIIPQLGAVGVNAKEVKRGTGFKVYFGPVRAADIPQYLQSKYKANEKMRRVRFNILDRLVLTPMELNPAMKKYPLFALLILVLFGLQTNGILFKNALYGGGSFLVLGFFSIISGAFLTPVLLPIIPFRSFAIKGFIMGVLVNFLLLEVLKIVSLEGKILLYMAYILFPLLSSYIALQFTGSTTFTGMTGVKKELKIAGPIYISGIMISVVLIIIYKLKELNFI